MKKINFSVLSEKWHYRANCLSTDKRDSQVQSRPALGWDKVKNSRHLLQAQCGWVWGRSPQGASSMESLHTYIILPTARSHRGNPFVLPGTGEGKWPLWNVPERAWRVTSAIKEHWLLLLKVQVQFPAPIWWWLTTACNSKSKSRSDIFNCTLTQKLYIYI